MTDNQAIELWALISVTLLSNTVSIDDPSQPNEKGNQTANSEGEGTDPQRSMDG